MASPPLPFPLSTGTRYDASSIELRFQGQRYIGCTEMEYSQELIPGVARGFTPQAVGFTRGVYTAKGRVTMFREEFDQLVSDATAILQGGFMEAMLIGEVNYDSAGGIPGLLSVTDQIIGMRITEDSHKISAGSGDALTVDMPFVALYILVGGSSGIPGLAAFSKLAQIAQGAVGAGAV